MNDLQLSLAIGLPIIANALGFGLISKRIDNLRSDMNARFKTVNNRFDHQSALFTEQLRRVEEVMDARMKHLEET